MLRRNVKPKKTPIKGAAPIKEEKKESPCSICSKLRPLANKTKKICVFCNKKIKLEALKERKAKKREKIKNTITQSKLDQMTSWLIRAAYEEKCYACEVKMDKKQLQCCHFVSRTKSMTRVDLRNLLPGCPTCNLYTPHHVWNLGKSLNRIWKEEMTEVLLKLSTVSLKLNNSDRKEIYDIYKDALSQIESQPNMSIEEKFVILSNADYNYSRVIQKLTRI
jgi:hypothetical protein